MRCSFCAQEIVKGTGKIYVKREGAVFYFCTKKCEKHQLKLERHPAKTRWTLKAAQTKKIALAAAGKSR